MSLKTSYTLLAPVHDTPIPKTFQRARSARLTTLPDSGVQILIDGAGTGLALPIH